MAAASPLRVEGKAHVRPGGGDIRDRHPGPGPAPHLSVGRTCPERAAPAAGPVGSRALRGGRPGVQGPEPSGHRQKRRLSHPAPPCVPAAPESGVVRAVTVGSGGRSRRGPPFVLCPPFASQPARRPCPRPGSVHVGAARRDPGRGQDREGTRLVPGADFASAAPHQVTTDLHQRCTDGHTGTSVSAPMVAGIIALALEAK